MAPYWFDTNIFLESKNRAYAFDIAPGFWTWIEKVSQSGLVKIPKIVYDEVYKHSGKKDQIANWLRMMNKTDGFCVNSDNRVAAKQAEILTHIHSRYTPEQAAFFSKGADPWLIAHAACCKGTVVTHETSSTKYKVQIPVVCQSMNVHCTDLYTMARKTGLKLVLSESK